MFHDSGATATRANPVTSIPLHYLDLTGHPVPASEQVNDRGFVVENYDPIAALSPCPVKSPSSQRSSPVGVCAASAMSPLKNSSDAIT